MDFFTWLQDLLSAPHGDDLPFSNSGLFILDSLRVLIILGGLATLVLTPMVIRKSTLPGQKVRFFAIALLVISSIGTEFVHLGDYAGWRFVFNTIAVTGTLWGQWSFLHYELPTQVQVEPDPAHVRVEIPPETGDIKTFLMEDETKPVAQ